MTVGCSSQDTCTDPSVLQCPPQEVLTANGPYDALFPDQMAKLPDAGIHTTKPQLLELGHTQSSLVLRMRAVGTLDFYLRGPESPLCLPSPVTAGVAPQRPWVPEPCTQPPPLQALPGTGQRHPSSSLPTRANRSGGQRPLPTVTPHH